MVSSQPAFAVHMPMVYEQFLPGKQSACIGSHNGSLLGACHLAAKIPAQCLSHEIFSPSRASKSHTLLIGGCCWAQL